jgi:hypothetical protein
MDKDQKREDVGIDRNTQHEKAVPEQTDQKKAKQNQQLTKEDLPDCTNESIGATGSGQRQDSN